jgi:5-methylcytosine-specific restriction enzyme subunit McrC
VKSSIPIENVYYLFCYAWDRFPEGKSIEVGTTGSPQIWDLFADVLIRGVERLMRRGLDRDYVEVQDDTSAVRGRIIIGETLRRNLLIYGRTNCRFDELKVDILHNQLIKATLRRLANADALNIKLRKKIRGLLRVLEGVSDVRLSYGLFRRVQLSRNNGHYDLLLKICELVHSALLPEEEGRGGKFAAILDDEERMSGVFELFVRNFFKTEQTEYSVGSEYIHWDVQAIDQSNLRFIPAMLTDITLRSERRNIIIDAKYYVEALQRHHGQEKIRSAHLYQLFSYLENFRNRSVGASVAEGILLYPTTSRSLDLTYTIRGHVVGIKTIQLNQPWKNIRDDMCSLLTSVPSGKNKVGAVVTTPSRLGPEQGAVLQA